MDFSFGRDLAVIWLSLFCMVGLIVPIAALYFAVRGMNVVQKKSVELIQQGQTQIKSARQQTERLSEQAVQPILNAQSRVAKAKMSVKRLAGRGSL